MDLSEFVSTHRPRWERLQTLLDRVEHAGLKALTVEEAQEFGRLYRSASSDLLAARGRAASADLVEYLNELVARGYAQTASGERTRPRDVWAFFARGYPQLVRREWLAVLLSYGLFWGGALFGYVAMAVDPGAAQVMVPEQHQSFDPDKRVEDENHNKGATGDQQAAFASFLFTHNIQVAFLCFAMGLTLGVGTVILLFYNGIMIGSLAWVYQTKGHAIWFWAWILPHGVMEISAICLAGAAGLLLGRALVRPGERTVADALREEGRNAVQLCLGTIPLFILAGLTEGTISQIHEPHLPSAVKLLYAAMTAALLVAYLGFAAREPAPGAAPVPLKA